MPKKKITQSQAEQDIIETVDIQRIDDESRTVYLIGDITEEMIRATVERIVMLSERDPMNPITLLISTYGGSVDDTFTLYDLMKYIPTPIHTVGLGKIMSAGCLLLAAGKKGYRKLGKNARMMYHCGWDYVGGNVFGMRAHLEAFERQEKQFDKMFAKETGLTIKQIEDLYEKDGPTYDHYISAEDALKLGIVDELI